MILIKDLVRPTIVLSILMTCERYLSLINNM
jgi:hypothetical protein